MGRICGLGVAAVFSFFVLAACGSGIPAEEVEARDQQIADLQAQVSLLQGQMADMQQDSKFWGQLTSFMEPIMEPMEPVEMPLMTDHRAFMLPTGGVMALHFDNMDLDRAENLNWVAFGVPSVFCADEPERVEAQFGAGFTHFHDMVNDLHGGAPGAEGVWFVHTAVRDFQAPWGAVSQGIDHDFMPTPPPDC